MRLLLVRGGCLLPPETQVPIRNSRGKVVRRIDMGWLEYRVGVAYDGGQHWTDPANHPDDILRRVRQALRSRMHAL